MMYMIVERFNTGKVKQLYKTFEEKGRQLPDGLTYINSWINEDVTVCYQLMETDEESKIQAWIMNWKHFADFEIIKVISSEEAKQKVGEL